MRCGAVAIFLTTTFMTAALAQSPSLLINMSEVAVGDHWLYRVRDEITGRLVGIQNVVVIDVTGDQVATRFVSTGRWSVVLYDKQWNLLRSGPNRFSPNSGSGIQSPVKVNAEWKTTADEINDDNGVVWTLNVNSQVTGQESVRTSAGAFETYTIETTQAARTEKDPEASRQISIRTWFSPEVNHWIRRNTVERVDGLVVRNETMELLRPKRFALRLLAIALC